MTKANIGQMKERLSIKFVDKVSNGRGGWIDEEIDRGTVWAEIKELSARNIVQYRQADMNTTTEIITRATNLIDRHCVFYAKGNKYLLEEIIEDKDGFYHIMAVGERNNGEQ